MDPLSWTGSTDTFFKIIRNEQKQKEYKNKIKIIIKTTTTNNAQLISNN